MCATRASSAARARSSIFVATTCVRLSSCIRSFSMSSELLRTAISSASMRSSSLSIPVDGTLEVFARREDGFVEGPHLYLQLLEHEEHAPHFYCRSGCTPALPSGHARSYLVEVCGFKGRGSRDACSHGATANLANSRAPPTGLVRARGLRDVRARRARAAIQSALAPPGRQVWNARVSVPAGRAMRGTFALAKRRTPQGK